MKHRTQRQSPRGRRWPGSGAPQVARRLIRRAVGWACDVREQQQQRRRRHAVEAAGVSERCGAGEAQLLDQLVGKSADIGVVEVGGDFSHLFPLQNRDVDLLAGDVRRHSGRRLRAGARSGWRGAPSSGQIERRRARSTPGKASSSNAVRRLPSRLISRPWAAAWLGLRVKASRAARPASRSARRRSKAARRSGPTQPSSIARRRQALIGVVGAQPQAELGARREHPIGLGDAAGDEVVDHHADVGVGAGDRDAVAAAGGERGVEAGQQALRGRLLVAGGAVDLAGEIEPWQPLDLQRRPQLARIDVVVLDRIAGPPDLDLLKPGDRAQERLLDLGRQRGRDAVGIDGIVVQPLGLEEDLVAGAVGEADDLVLDRRAIARARRSGWRRNTSARGRGSRG